MGSEKSACTIAFASAAEADRRVAGVAAAARAVREQAEAGASRIRLGTGCALSAATLADIERVSGGAGVEIVFDGEGGPGRYPHSSWEIVRRTGKPGDGFVSRWLNRPISQRVTWLVLLLPWARPVHVTIFNALLALFMVPVLLLGGEAGLIAGGILFQAASILDGVDGEMARATWRSSPAGATLDSLVDIATNLLFVTALTIALALRDGDAIGWIGAWAVTLSVLGGLLLGLGARRGGGPVGFDRFKRRGRGGGLIGLIYWVVQILTGRDCFAFLFMALILVGLERTALMIYAGVGTIWFPYVLVSVLLIPRLSHEGRKLDFTAL